MTEHTWDASKTSNDVNCTRCGAQIVSHSHGPEWVPDPPGECPNGAPPIRQVTPPMPVEFLGQTSFEPPKPTPKRTTTRVAFRHIVCLCGSTRFTDAFRDANDREALAGNIVLSVGCDTKSPDSTVTAAQKAELDELHLDKIDMADEVYVLDVEGYVGESTQREIAYAVLRHKPIRWLTGAVSGEKYLEGHARKLGALAAKLANDRGFGA